MYQNELSKAINQAVISCMDNGRGEEDCGFDDKVCAEWESWDCDENYDVITIYIFQDNIMRLRYQDANTKLSTN